jgi:DeoR family transcriptional regulator of aga operon
MNQLLSLSTEQRQNEILGQVKSQGRVAVSQLSVEFDVSEATIRRDLRQMAANKLLQRVHGGAIRVHRMELEPPFLQRTRLHTREKQRIGAAAAHLINPGETVILIGGSTTLEIAPYLAQKENLTIITDSLLIAQSIAKNSTTTVILLGGVVRNSELTTGGHLVQLCLHELRANKVIFGVRAVNFDQGLLLDAAAEVMIFRQCIQAANDAILVVDHSKFGQTATAALGPLTLVTRIVTDDQISPEFCVRLRNLHIEVILA